MAILNSCCCWKSVRRGSFAVAVYSLVYNLVLVTYLWPEAHLSQSADYPTNSVILPEEKKRQEHQTVLAHLSRAMFVLSLAGLLACLLLFIGLCKDRPWLLLPWIVVAILVIVVDVVFVNYILWQNKLSPVVAITFTMDFFFMVLNIYGILCVVSQFQEYKAGRGTARDEQGPSPPVIRYTRQSTLNSGLEGAGGCRRTGGGEGGETGVSFNGVTTTNQVSGSPRSLSSAKQDVGGRSANFLLPTAPPLPLPLSRTDNGKHVQFPTHTHAVKQMEEAEASMTEEDNKKKKEENEDKENRNMETQEEEKEERKNRSRNQTLPYTSSPASSPPCPPLPPSSSSSSSPTPTPSPLCPSDAPLLPQVNTPQVVKRY